MIAPSFHLSSLRCWSSLQHPWICWLTSAEKQDEVKCWKNRWGVFTQVCTGAGRQPHHRRSLATPPPVNWTQTMFCKDFAQNDFNRDRKTRYRNVFVPHEESGAFWRGKFLHWLNLPQTPVLRRCNPEPIKLDSEIKMSCIMRTTTFYIHTIKKKEITKYLSLFTYFTSWVKIQDFSATFWKIWYHGYVASVLWLVIIKKCRKRKENGQYAIKKLLHQLHLYRLL